MPPNVVVPGSHTPSAIFSGIEMPLEGRDIFAKDKEAFQRLVIAGSKSWDCSSPPTSMMGDAATSWSMVVSEPGSAEIPHFSRIIAEPPVGKSPTDQTSTVAEGLAAELTTALGFGFEARPIAAPLAVVSTTPPALYPVRVSPSLASSELFTSCVSRTPCVVDEPELERDSKKVKLEFDIAAVKQVAQS